MDIMNLIHAICLNKQRIDSTPKWKIFTLQKENKTFNKLISEFADLDIFDASNNFISFLLSLGELSNSVWGINYDENYLSIDLDAYYIIGGVNSTHAVVYYPKSNRFEITGEDVSYTIYRNTKNSNKINKMWEPLTIELKSIYADKIIEMAEYISTPHLLQ